jgi:hypothetical protein
MIQGWITDTYENKKNYVDGKIHPINDEPAAIWTDGTKIWYKEGLWHRESGPALIHPDGHRSYYLENEYYPEITSDLEWLLKVEELKRT